jgi:RHS repeat-associated protein
LGAAARGRLREICEGWTGSACPSTANSYTWDASNHCTALTDSAVATTVANCANTAQVTMARCYDDLGRVLSEGTPQGTVSYGYHANGGPRATLSAPNQSQVSYTYGSGDRLSQISQGTANVSFTYDSLSRRASLTLPNGISVGYGYDTGGQVTGLTYTLSGSTMGQLTYGYDNAGQRLTVSGSYARTGLPAATSTQNPPQYDAANRLSSWNGTSLRYDANGNLLCEGWNGTSCPTTARSYQWNARNQLTGISGAVTASFSYNALGRRTTGPVSGTSTNYLYDGANPVQEQVSGTATANSLTGGLDERFTRTEGSVARTLLPDALGSTVALTDSTGAVQTAYRYEPFGKSEVSSGSANANPYQYTGRENDGATDLYFYRARYYHPTWQRFISEDPLGFGGGDVNFYAYAGNSPTNFSDPFGLEKGPGRQYQMAVERTWAERWHDEVWRSLQGPAYQPCGIRVPDGLEMPPDVDLLANVALAEFVIEGFPWPWFQTMVQDL